MQNGPVVIERLEIIRRSLNRALSNIDEELATRSPLSNCKDAYAGKVTALVDLTNRLEDEIHKVTTSIY